MATCSFCLMFVWLPVGGGGGSFCSNPGAVFFLGLVAWLVGWLVGWLIGWLVGRVNILTWTHGWLVAVGGARCCLN